MPRLTLRAAAAAAGLALVLTASACSAPAEPEPTPSPSPSATETQEPSASPTPTPSVSVPVVATLDGIKVTGDAGADPAITFAAPMAIDETRSQVLIPGSGPIVTEGATIEVNYKGIRGRDAEVFDSSFTRGAPTVFPIARTVPGFAKGLVGKKVGDRVLIAMPGSDAYDEAVKAGMGPAGMQEGDTLIFVVDLIATSVTKPTGETVTPEYKQVTVTGDDKPEAKIPSAETPPAALTTQPLVKGTGRAVAAEDVLIVHYRTWSWKTGKMVEDRFDQDQAGRLADTLEAWKKGLVGQSVGSRVLMVAPAADTYPAGNPKLSIEAGDTLVYVVDILFASQHMQ